MRGKKFVCAILVALLVAGNTTVGFCKKLFDQYWKPGQYPVEVSAEEISTYTDILETALKNAEGTYTRQYYETATYEDAYQNYLYMTADGTLPEYEFDDVGQYGCDIGLPDDKSISQEQALFIAYHAVREQYNITDDELTHYLPFYIYRTYDAENPTWDISLQCYDGSLRPLRIFIYAYDGCVQGIIRSTVSNG